MFNIIRKPVVSPIERLELTTKYPEAGKCLIVTRSKKYPGTITLYTKGRDGENECFFLEPDEQKDFLEGLKELMKA